MSFRASSTENRTSLELPIETTMSVSRHAEVTYYAQVVWAAVVTHYAQEVWAVVATNFEQEVWAVV